MRDPDSGPQSVSRGGNRFKTGKKHFVAVCAC